MPRRKCQSKEKKGEKKKKKGGPLWEMKRKHREKKGLNTSLEGERRRVSCSPKAMEKRRWEDPS